jgi:hypothetical protein
VTFAVTGPCKEEQSVQRRGVQTAHGPRQAAFNQAAVSKALLIIGMFMPKFGLVPFLGTTLTACLAAGAALLVGATSVARSHDPFSWERATEKNKNT